MNRTYSLETIQRALPWIRSQVPDSKLILGTLAYPKDAPYNNGDVERTAAIFKYAQERCLRGVAVTFVDYDSNSNMIQYALQRVMPLTLNTSSGKRCTQSRLIPLDPELALKSLD
jgi:hypothetical protein